MNNFIISNKPKKLKKHWNGMFYRGAGFFQVFLLFFISFILVYIP